RRIASASENSPVSVGLVRATSPVGTRPQRLGCDSRSVSCTAGRASFHLETRRALRPCAPAWQSPEGEATYCGQKQGRRPAGKIEVERSHRQPVTEHEQLVARQGAKEGFQDDGGLLKAGVQVVVQDFKANPALASGRGRRLGSNFTGHGAGLGLQGGD